MKDKRQLSVIRILILVFIALSAVIAIVQYKHKSLFIAQLMGLSWGAMAGSFLGPYLYGLYCKSISPASVWVSYVFGVGVMVLNTFCPAIFPAWLESPISCGAFVMVADLVLVPLVSLVTKAPDRAFVENVFSCYEKKVVVRAEEAIGDEENPS